MDFNIEIENIVSDIRHYFVNNGNEDTKAVIGISGGKDSTIAAALLVKALGSERVVGVMMPEYHQDDLDDAYEVCAALGIPHYCINIGLTCEELYGAFVANTAHTLTNQITTNTPARIRMTTLYMVAAAVGGRVINTGNASESYVGYTTKYGDLAGDYAVLRGYYVTEIYQLGEHLFWDDGTPMLPHHLIRKPPADGMSGKTDEDNMGFTYEELDNYLINDITPSASVLYNIEMRHERNLHKYDIHIWYPRAKTRYGQEDDLWKF